MKLIRYLFIILILFNSYEATADVRNNELNRLFNELKIDNATLADEIEQKIWKIWSTHPTNQQLTNRLSEGSSLVKNKKLSNAVKIYSEVINEDPKWAEAWNKRATVLYIMGDYQGSQGDIDKVLELEKRHFGALAGQGLVNIKLRNYEKAKEIYPTMKSPEIMIKQIEELIKQELI